MKLLEVDDREDICEVIRAYLTELGFDVTSATHQARHLLETESFDLAILDVLMPGESGLSLACFAEERGVSVLLMSGHPQILEDFEQRRTHYPLPVKPFRNAELARAVMAAVRSKQHSR